MSSSREQASDQGKDTHSISTFCQSILQHQADSHPSHGNLGKRSRIRRMARAEMELRQLRPGARITNGPRGEAPCTRFETGQAAKAEVEVFELRNVQLLEILSTWTRTASSRRMRRKWTATGRSKARTHRTRRRRTEALWRKRKLHHKRAQEARMAKEIIKHLMTEV